MGVAETLYPEHTAQQPPRQERKSQAPVPRMLQFPEDAPWPESVNGAELFTDLEKFLNRVMVLWCRGAAHTKTRVATPAGAPLVPSSAALPSGDRPSTEQRVRRSVSTNPSIGAALPLPGGSCYKVSLRSWCADVGKSGSLGCSWPDTRVSLPAPQGHPPPPWRPPGGLLDRRSSNFSCPRGPEGEEELRC